MKSLKYFLMHRNIPVAKVRINDTTSTIYCVDEVMQPEHLPIGMDTHSLKTLSQDLTAWFMGRSIPASRYGFQQALDKAFAEKQVQLSSSKLLMQCYGLSLSDQYWVNPENSPLTWEQINFYDNPFSEDMGDLLFGQFPQSEAWSFLSPCNTSDGWLPKKWKILDGKRMLIKGGSGMAQQEPFNELVADAICERLSIPHVPYSLIWENGKAYSVCPDMTNSRQDLVSAYYLAKAPHSTQNCAAYGAFIRHCADMGIPDARQRIDQMIVLDFLIANTDRHFGNFGAIRDAVTLGWCGIAPVFDCGTSLWHETYGNSINGKNDPPAKPFAASQSEQLKLIAGDTEWIDLSALKGLSEECLAIFEQAHFAEPNRATALSNALQDRCQLFGEALREIRAPMVAVGKDINTLCEEARSKASHANRTGLPETSRERER